MSRTVAITWRPLTQWPNGRARTPYGQRENARFLGKSTMEGPEGSRRYVPAKPLSLSRVLDDLDRELSQVDAQNVVIQIDVAKDREISRLSDLTNVSTPAVVLTFTRRTVPHVFACDFFKRWQDNLRAIAKGLESLRLLERYHIAQTGDQYRGWQALPASTTTAFSSEAAANVLGGRSNQAPAAILRDREIARKAYREAASNSHPDAPSGSTTDFQLVQEAKRVLEAHHGGAL